MWPDSRIELSVVIPAHQGGGDLCALLESLSRQENPPVYEVLVVANPPQENIKRFVSAFSFAKYLETDSIGANFARNVGLKEARGEIVLFIDEDCFADDPLFLRRHYELHQLHPEISGLGGPYAFSASGGTLDHAYHHQQTKWILEGYCPSYHVDLLLGGNMSFRRSKLVGLWFDEALLFGGTETEFFYRLASLGHRVKLFSGLRIEHRTNLSVLSYLTKAFQQGRGAAHLEKKWGKSLPLVKRNVSSSQEPPGGRSLWGFLYAWFFRAGHSGHETLRPGSPSPRQLGGAALREAQKAGMARFRYLIFVEIWSTLQSVRNLISAQRSRAK